jgi:uncharacterized DUF497 family protein
MAPFVDPGAPRFKFTWCEDKRRANLKKHGLDLLQAAEVFQGVTVTEIDDSQDYGEDRWITPGLLNRQVVVIVHTEIDDTVHIISLRHAEPHESKAYFTAV